MNRFRPSIFAALLFTGALFAEGGAAAAPGPAGSVDDARDAVRAVRLQADERLVLDGTLNHPAWQRAPAHASFVAKDPVFGVAPPQRTEFRVLFDEQALYVGVTAHDSAPALVRDPIVRADQVIRTQDFVVVYIDAIGSKRSAQFFRVNAAGSTGDGLHTAADDNEDFSPDFDWDATVARRVPGLQGWTAVFRLPFASLRFAPGAHDWRILVGRRLPREHLHLMTSVPIPRDVPSFIHTMQPLTGVGIPKDSQFLSVRPSLTLRHDSNDSNDKARARAWDASLDIKWRPRAELVVDGTLNPDFSQVALDVPQLAGNSKFALFFPEKRPFFFESADLLRSPTEAFYTRSYTQPRWGLRATWRDTGWAGSAFTLNDKGGGLVLLPGAYGTDSAAQPASLAAAVRARSDSATGNLQFGGLAATRKYANGGGENTVLGPDLHWQINEGWRLRGQWLASQTSAQPDADGVLRLASGPGARSGQKRYLRALYQGDGIEGNVSYEDTSAGFRHDSGFVNQAGVRRVNGWFAKMVAKDFGPFDEFWLNAEADAVTDWQGGPQNGQTVSSMWRPGIWTRGASGLEWWFEAYGHSRLRTAAHAPLLAERFLASGIVYSPAAWFPLLEGKLIAGQMADTATDRLRPGGNSRWLVRLRPLARLELETTVSGAWLRHGGQSAYREVAAQLLSVWHFDARHSLRGIWQRTALQRRAETGLGVEAARDTRQVTSVTYAWRESAGTLLYAGGSWSRQSHLGPASDAARTAEVFVKLQMDWGEARTRLAAARGPREP